jgi:predicted lipoprotein with Yx(FWY)xxD motif
MASRRWTASERGSGPASSTQTKGTGTRAWALAGLLLTGVAPVAGLVVGAPGVAGASPAKTIKVGTANVPHVGVVLTTGSGLTLYYFTEDPRGKATCTGACAKVWPPYTTAKGAHISGPKGVKGLSLINTGHGHWQVAFDHAALYRFQGDSKKGQAKGQGVIGKWYVAMESGITAGTAPAAGAAVTAPTSTTTTAPASTTTQAPPAATTTPMAQTPATSAPPTPATTPAPPPTTTPTTLPPATTTPTTSGGGYGY